MNKELIINAVPQGVEIALLEDKKLVELHHEKTDASFAVGDLYLGKVKKLIPGLNAAFVDVGFEKDAFLHYTDLSPYARSLLKFTQQAINDNNANGFDFSNFLVEPEIIKTGKINEVLNGKPNLLVQILKEPIAAKGPRLSCEISLPGRFVVITPFNDIVAVSRKIHSADERKRLQKIVEAIKSKNFGVIVRTAAEGKNTAELHEDLAERCQRDSEAVSRAERLVQRDASLGKCQRLFVLVPHQRDVRLIVDDAREHIIGLNCAREALTLTQRSCGFLAAPRLREQNG